MKVSLFYINLMNETKHKSQLYLSTVENGIIGTEQDEGTIYDKFTKMTNDQDDK